MTPTQAIIILQELIAARKRTIHNIKHRSRTIGPDEMILVVARHENVIRALNFAIALMRDNRNTNVSDEALQRLFYAPEPR